METQTHKHGLVLRPREHLQVAGAVLGKDMRHQRGHQTLRTGLRRHGHALDDVPGEACARQDDIVLIL